MKWELCAIVAVVLFGCAAPQESDRTSPVDAAGTSSTREDTRPATNTKMDAALAKDTAAPPVVGPMDTAAVGPIDTAAPRPTPDASVRVDSAPPAGKPDAAAPSLWSQVQSILTFCSGCHEGGSKVIDLNDPTGDLHERIVGKVMAAGDCKSKTPIAPGNLENSFLYQSVIAGGKTGCTKNTRMPPGNTKLTDTEIKAMKDWILAGAKED